MRRLLLTLALMAGMCAAAAFANYTATQGTGTNFLSFDTGGVKSAAATLANSSGTEIGTAAAPVEINLRSSTVGIATSANQTTGNSSLSTIATNTTGVATAANQATEITSLATIATNTGAAIPAGTNLVGKVGIDQTTPGTTNLVALAANQSVNLSQVNGVTTLTGTGATGTGAQRVTVSTDQATNAGAALVKGGVGTVNGGSFYQAVAAGATATVLQSSTGAIGDYLSHCVLYPTSTSPGVVTVFDNTNAAAGSAILFPGGATSLSNLAPIAIPVGAVSTAGAWKVTTGTAISVVCYGKFS